jgi:hypothetical protein
MKVAKEVDEWFGCTTVPVNVNSSCNNLVAEENRVYAFFENHG